MREDEAIDLLVNNAGANQHGGLSALDLDELDGLISLNVLAMTRLTAAVLPRFLARSEGTIVNVASVVALAPEIPFGIYGATKSYVLALSESLQAELGPRGLYVQAVLPGATRTELWERSGRDVNALKAVMDVDELVDAAMVGFDRRELVTVPALGNVGLWEAYETARKAILPEVMTSRAAERYRAGS